MDDFVMTTGNSNAAVQSLRVMLPDVLNTTSYSSMTKGPSTVLGVVTTPQGWLLEYPPAPLTALTTTLSNQQYGNGTYTVTPSPNGSWANPERVFDRVTNSFAISYAYTYGTGLPAGTTVTVATNGTSYFGEWIDIVLPEPVFPSAYVVNPGPDGARQVSQFTLLGSRDNGTTWVQLHSQPYGDLAFAFYTFPVSNTLAFSRYRLVIQRSGEPWYDSFRDFVRVDEWRIVGTPLTQTNRLGQQGHGGTVVCNDARLFDRPLRVQVAPSSTDQPWTPADWSMRLRISAAQ